jgi:hypothetical protein
MDERRCLQALFNSGFICVKHRKLVKSWSIHIAIYTLRNLIPILKQ